MCEGEEGPHKTFPFLSFELFAIRYSGTHHFLHVFPGMAGTMKARARLGTIPCINQITKTASRFGAQSCSYVLSHVHMHVSMNTGTQEHMYIHVLLYKGGKGCIDPTHSLKIECLGKPTGSIIDLANMCYWIVGADGMQGGERGEGGREEAISRCIFS